MQTDQITITGKPLMPEQEVSVSDDAASGGTGTAPGVAGAVTVTPWLPSGMELSASPHAASPLAAMPGGTDPAALGAIAQPPSTNRGALITYPFVNQFLIDWAAFTFKLKDPCEVLKIIDLNQALFMELERGIHGYRKSLRFGNICVYFDGQANMGCHVVMSGQGCRQYEGQFAHNPWLELLTNSIEHQASFTRLDLANDNVDEKLDLERLKASIIKREIRSRFTKAIEIKEFSLSRDASTANDGHTINFGKRVSRVVIRFYDKAAQLEIPLPWIRAEIELKDKRAQLAVMQLVAGMPVGQLFTGIINVYLAVINLDDSNISRCTVQGWWSDWLQSTEKIRLTTDKQIRCVEEVMEFVKRQYSPSLAMIKEHLGDFSFREYIRDVLTDGTKRMGMKHEQMLFVSAQGKADNYSSDQEEFEERAAIMEHDGGLSVEEAEKAAKMNKTQQSNPDE